MAITRVQGNKKGISNTSSITITLDSAPINGNALVAVITNEDISSLCTVSSISQSGVTWTKQESNSLEVPAGLFHDIEIWFGVVGSGASSSLTVTLSEVPEYGAVANVCEYSGLATSDFLDQTAFNSGVTSPTDTGTTDETTQADELWIGAIYARFEQYTPTNGFTLMDGATFNFHSNAYLEKIVSSTGTANSGTTETQERWVGCIATFKASGGATLQTVTDSLGLSDSVLRHKTLLPITDVLGLADAVLRNKTLTIADSVGASTVARSNKSPLIVTDALGLVDAILRNKQFAVTDTVALAELIDVIKGLILKTVTDSVGLNDVVLRNKVLALIDAISLSDAVSTPSRVLQALDAVGLADGALVNKVLQVTEGISLAEVVEVGVGGAKKTKLFLVLGDIAIQLSGD